MKGHTNDATRASTSVPVDTASASGSDFHELLPRLTKKVFLGIWMTGLDLLMGIVFPFFVMTFGVPSGYVRPLDALPPRSVRVSSSERPTSSCREHVVVETSQHRPTIGLTPFRIGFGDPAVV